MPHELMIDDTRVPLLEGAEVGRADAVFLRVHYLPGETLVVIIGAEASTRDGFPLVGQLAVVDRGTSALIRAVGLRAQILWRGGVTQRVAEAGQRCRLCLGLFRVQETAVICGCEAAFHLDCERVRFNCPGCGAAREDAAREDAAREDAAREGADG